ncbi:hypothetical protein B6U90_03060 [Thermoplasmatales archaeon ex4484_6]|nr:MAG: hypothetical protein B6U90_03060 [Thermoplasmatales archaeon ex4484_6]RLF68394.1 MAG: hypothetical protein DRN57_04185 [Thermoplasmata archaeon]
MLIKGDVPVRMTEDPEKVKKAILLIFPEASLEELEGSISFTTDDPARFVELVTNQKIRDSSLLVLGGSMSDDSTSFFLNKQAAFMGKVNFTEGRSTLGDMHVIVEEGARELVKMITPDGD